MLKLKKHFNQYKQFYLKLSFLLGWACALLLVLSMNKPFDWVDVLLSCLGTLFLSVTIVCFATLNKDRNTY
ncbi:hypothetical protein [Acinetobacter sp. P1(2025)]|uniref:hypothetical protein n=1 Tax=Acinetobacter sp. P1(2025) TaxID=3446120 RepID=UPI003F53B100